MSMDGAVSPILVEWRTVADALSEFEYAYLDALRVAESEHEVLNLDVTSHENLQPRIVVLAYRAALSDAGRLHDAVDSACRRHERPPARLLTIACGVSDSDVIELVSKACDLHSWHWATDPESMGELVLSSLVLMSRRLAAMRVSVTLSSLPSVGTSPTAQERIDTWPPWIAG
ncbi:hypothetical protein GCM10025792_24000 [Pseudonocardia tropica]